MSETLLRVTVVVSPGSREVREQEVDLPPGATVADALHACGVAGELATAAGIGIWGRQVLPARLLCDGDRVELYRPLRVDPMVARRERFARQGARGAGLFARRRPGAKPGY